ncbi:MAG: DUF2130 domain-containing protein, partial [Verrucomicrobiales bacterium]
MNNNNIVCPSCKTEIELTSAVAHHVREQLAAELKAEREKQEVEFDRKSAELQAQLKKLKQDQSTLEDQVEEKLRLERSRLHTEAKKKAASELELQMNALNEELRSKTEKLAVAHKAELDLRRKEQALIERQQEMELEITKKLAEERAKLQETAREHALSEQQLKMADKDKQISELRSQIEALSHTANKVSQQLQGEVLEAQFESELRKAFPFDEITAIKTGANGADLIQVVRTSQGTQCGSILWEVKRTNHYQKLWINKLKEDQREKAADLAVILTQALPDGCEHFEQREGVWVTAYHCGMGLAAALRQGLMQVASARRSSEGKKEKMELLYQYLCGVEFRQRIEAFVDGFVTLKNELESERWAMERIWGKREK